MLDCFQSQGKFFTHFFYFFSTSPIRFCNLQRIVGLKCKISPLN